MRLPQIYPITNTELARLSHLSQAEGLIECGAELIQIREKNAPASEFFKAAKSCVEISRNTSTKIIINDRVDIALATRADGVHLGQDDLSPLKAREILGDQAVIGYSTHNLKQAEKAIDLPIDYLAIGPVFPTDTKHNAEDSVGLKTVSKIKDIAKEIPLVAIGGIDQSNFLEVLSAGADSVAVISSLFSGGQILSKNFTEFLAKLKSQ